MTTASAAILSTIQRDAFAWQVKNFGRPNALVMLAGVTEEYGESCESMADTALWLDAVGDSCIYLMQFCSVLGWDVGELWDMRDVVRLPDGRAWPQLMGKINHHYVKGRIQHYRGTQDEHDFRCRVAIAALLRHWEAHIADMGRDFIAVVDATWRVVSARDWTADRAAPGDGFVAVTGMQRMAVELEGMIPADRRMDRGLSYEWANAAWQEGVMTVAATIRRAYAQGILAQGWRAHDAAKAQAPGDREETAS